MTYATKNDLVTRYGLAELVTLTDRTKPPAGAENDAIIAQALSDADAEINSILAAKMTTPVDPVPSILVPRACAIARFFLHYQRVPDSVRQEKDDALAWFAQVRDGKISLGNAETPTPAAASPGRPQFTNGGERRFTTRSMGDL